MSSPFDINAFYFGTIIILSLGIMSMMFRKSTRGALVAFIGFLFGIVFTVAINADGTFAGVASGADASVWPFLYLPIFFTILDAAIAFYSVVD